MNVSNHTLNNKPVIGILTIPLAEWSHKMKNQHTINSTKAKSYLPEAYVRWIENSGARVVPIQYNLTKPIMLGLLAQVNGVIICGESSTKNFIKNHFKSEIHPDMIRWMKSAFVIYEFAKHQNHQDKYFPLLGIGKGYEELYFMEAETNYYKNLSMNKKGKKYKLNNELIKISDKLIKNRVLRLIKPLSKFNPFSKKDVQLWGKKKVIYSTAYYGINIHKKKHDFLTIHAKSRKNNNELAMLYSFKEYPFYGFNFHPEVFHYSWSHNELINKNINETVDFSQKLSYFFVDECRRNNIALVSKKILIYNYTLHSLDNTLRILFPRNWEMVQFKKQFTPTYFFGLIKN